ncbi:MAG: TIR domain-containing protein [Rhodanobacteraceae bacterium]
MTIPPKTSGFGYRAFISYSHQDQVWAQWLHKALETYRVPSHLVGKTTAAGPIPRRLTPIFRDRDELASATDLGRKVNEALAQSANLIVICSPQAAASRWVNEEVLAYKRLGREDRIFCVLVAGEPNASDIPGREAEECFADALRFKLDAAGQPTRERTEPVAADARTGKDGKPNAKLKLIAGMLDVGFDALKQREQQRRNRKWAALAAASFAGMLITGGLSVYALRARHEAIAQRSEAEGLIEFMLGDLRKTLEPVGRLDALDSVGKRALAYYAAQNTRGLDADELGRRARALHLIGEVDDLRGNLDEALGVFNEAAESTGELLARAPNDAQRIFDHAQSVYWVGYVAFQRGQNDVAENAFIEYRNLAEQLVALDPAKSDWQAEVEYAYSNLGTLLIKQGRSAEAAAAFERSLAISSALARAAPDDVDRQLEDAQSHAWLADAHEKQGRLGEALRLREAELATYQSVLAIDPNNNDAKRGVLVASGVLARLSVATGELAQATTRFEVAAKFADQLIAAEPKNTDWADMSAQIYAGFGEALYFTSDDTGARAEVARATQIAERLIQNDSSVIRWQAFLLSRCNLLQALLTARAGDHAAALKQAQQVVLRIKGLEQSEKIDQLIRWQLATALLVSGDELQALGRSEEARHEWQRATALLSENQEREDPLMQTILATALLRLGRRDEASPILARLNDIGYRHPAFVEVHRLFAGGADFNPPDASIPAQAASVAANSKQTHGR